MLIRSSWGECAGRWGGGAPLKRALAWEPGVWGSSHPSLALGERGECSSSAPPWLCPSDLRVCTGLWTRASPPRHSADRDRCFLGP